MARFIWFGTAQPSLEYLFNEHLSALRARGYSPFTVRNRFVHIRSFLRWCAERRICLASEVTHGVLEGYQRYLSVHQKRNGLPLELISQHAALVPLRVWFRWMHAAGHIRHDPTERLELPRLGQHLPRNILSATEIGRVMRGPNTKRAIGLRDRAILEVLYSTGMRRLELLRLQTADLHLNRGLIFVREGKGRRDRYVPISVRAAQWVKRYLRRSRPRLARDAAIQSVFLSRKGREISRDQLTWIVRKHVTNAKLSKSGACHLFRHSMATLMHENGADIRVIQQILGHADIRTTQIYTQAAISTLQRVHARTLPSA